MEKPRDLTSFFSAAEGLKLIKLSVLGARKGKLGDIQKGVPRSASILAERGGMGAGVKSE